MKRKANFKFSKKNYFKQIEKAYSTYISKYLTNITPPPVPFINQNPADCNSIVNRFISHRTSKSSYSSSITSNQTADCNFQQKCRPRVVGLPPKSYFNKSLWNILPLSTKGVNFYLIDKNSLWFKLISNLNSLEVISLQKHSNLKHTRLIKGVSFTIRNTLNLLFKFKRELFIFSIIQKIKIPTRFSM